MKNSYQKPKNVKNVNILKITRVIPIRSKISQITIVNMLVTNLFIKQYDEKLLSKTKKREKRKYP